MPLCLFTLLVGSCSGFVPTVQTQKVNALNERSYRERFVSLDSAESLAQEAYGQAVRYRNGRAEAAANLSFVALQQLDFSRVIRLRDEIYSLTKNEVELLLADVTMMRVCQLKAANQMFYDYKNSAEKHLNRIEEEGVDAVYHRQQHRLLYAKTLMLLTLADYHSQLQQEQRALDAFAQIAEPELQTDTTIWLSYFNQRASRHLYSGLNVEEQRQTQLNDFIRVWLMGQRTGMISFEISALRGLARMMSSQENEEYCKEVRPMLTSMYPDLTDREYLSMGFVDKAIELNETYGDKLQFLQNGVVKAEVCNMHRDYRMAIDVLDGLAVADSALLIPEIRLQINEQYSIAYAGLNDKQQSDVYRNAYLDILEETRQDREIESRYQKLKQETDRMSILLALVCVGFALIVGCVFFLNKFSRKRHQLQLHRLQHLVNVTQQLLSAVPQDVQEAESVEWYIDNVDLNGLDENQRKVIEPYRHWALENGYRSIHLAAQRQLLEAQSFSSMQHIRQAKHEHIIKKTCISLVGGIVPYIDRILGEVKVLLHRSYAREKSVRQEKYQYIDELISTINQQNDILADWIKIRQGVLSLQIENFALQELFEVLKQGSRTYELRRQTFVVHDTTAVVKADKALTLFMLNTLSENARKYTGEGGTITVEALEMDSYVELSVKDTGIGLSAHDVNQILGEKVYDSAQIGLDVVADVESLSKQKGSGFGLMNCKGIIEKYKKTGEFFRDCMFGIDSEPGHGSRFYFRLPKGVLKTLVVCLLFCWPWILYAQPDKSDDDLLETASMYANEAYYSNIDGRYGDAIAYIDSAMIYLNEYYIGHSSNPKVLLRLVDEEPPAELTWWNGAHETDYYVILDIRNEAAVASLALHDWVAYQYNNKAYTELYKLLGEDNSLEMYCQRLERTVTTQRMLMVTLVLLLLLFLGSIYFLVIRKRLLYKWHLEQVLDVNRSLFDSIPVNEISGLDSLSQRIVDVLFAPLNELIPLKCLCLAIYDSQSQRFNVVMSNSLKKVPESFRNLIHEAFDTNHVQTKSALIALPLTDNVGETEKRLGVLLIESSDEVWHEEKCLHLKLVADYLALIIDSAIVNIQNKQHDVETARDEALRMALEDNNLHVKNLVLDNCLSTIKHETMYYPNRIKLLVSQLLEGTLTVEEETDKLQSVSELINYYKVIYSILYACASRQLEEVFFRRSLISADSLLSYVARYFKKAMRGRSLRISLDVRCDIPITLIGDEILLQFMLENLIDASLRYEEAGQLLLVVTLEDSSAVFRFSDKRRNFTQEELNQLFYPQSEREFLICKQIIRDHDEFVGRRNSRILAEPIDGGGYSVVFNIPCRQPK